MTTDTVRAALTDQPQSEPDPHRVCMIDLCDLQSALAELARLGQAECVEIWGIRRWVRKEARR